MATIESLPNCPKVDANGHCEEAISIAKNVHVGIFGQNESGQQISAKLTLVLGGSPAPSEDAILKKRGPRTWCYGLPIQCNEQGHCLIFRGESAKVVPFDPPEGPSWGK